MTHLKAIFREAMPPGQGQGDPVAVFIVGYIYAWHHNANGYRNDGHCAQAIYYAEEGLQLQAAPLWQFRVEYGQ